MFISCRHTRVCLTAGKQQLLHSVGNYWTTFAPSLANNHLRQEDLELNVESERHWIHIVKFLYQTDYLFSYHILPFLGLSWRALQKYWCPTSIRWECAHRYLYVDLHFEHQPPCYSASSILSATGNNIATSQKLHLTYISITWWQCTRVHIKEAGFVSSRNAPERRSCSFFDHRNAPFRSFSAYSCTI